MNTSAIHDNLMCNQTQILKSLPLKKRRAYMFDASTTNNNQNDYQSTPAKKAYSQEDSLQIHISAPTVVPTPPSSPHLELLRQQYAYMLANPATPMPQNFYHPPTYDSLMAQQYYDNYRTSIEHQRNYPMVEDQQRQTDVKINEHFRKSVGNNYIKYSGRCLTPDDSSSNSSPTEKSPVDSIEEHFARSLAKFRSSNNGSLSGDQISSINHKITESVVDDHFAKALGSTTWDRLKEKL